MSRKLRAVSLFSGCGGFDLGARRAGVEIIWANDIDQYAATVYRRVFPGVEFVLSDVRGVKEFPEADILIGCYPCTGFSLGARRRWRGRPRDLNANDSNHLYQEFLRALRQVRPRYLFVENVKGMVCANGGWFLERQIEGIRQLGFRVKAALLNAADYGVPQSRKRVFIVGVRIRRNWSEYSFPTPTHGPRGSKPYAVLRDTIGDMPAWPAGEFFDYPFHGHYLTRNRKRGWAEPSYTVVADAHHVPLHPSGKPMRFVGTDTWELQGRKNRRLSWRECAAIQGLPLSPFSPDCMQGNYRVIGNAVPPAVAEKLLKPVLDFEDAL